MGFVGFESVDGTTKGGVGRVREEGWGGGWGGETWEGSWLWRRRRGCGGGLYLESSLDFRYGDKRIG